MVDAPTLQTSDVTTRSLAMKKRGLTFSLFALFVGALPPGFAFAPDDLDPSRKWRFDALSFSGITNLTEAELRSTLTLKNRPRDGSWSKHILLDTIDFAADLRRLTRFYQSNGDYDVSVTLVLTSQANQADQTERADTVPETPIQQTICVQDIAQTPRVTPMITVSEGQASTRRTSGHPAT